MRDVSLPEAAAAIATSEVWKPPINGDGSAGADRIRGSKVTLVCGSEIVPRKLSWCWQGWIARGKMQIIAGPPGSGKTTVALSFTATITQGGQWPDGTCHPGGGNVVVWSGEDDPEDTLVPRLIAAGADLGHVFLIRGVLDAGQERPFDPAKDMAGLEEAIRLIGGAELIIVDPIVSAVGGDSHKNGETRRALQPLVDLAAKTHAALLGISHLSKNTGGRDPVERVTGSIAFSAVARLVMIAAKELSRKTEPKEGAFWREPKAISAPTKAGLHIRWCKYRCRIRKTFSLASLNGAKASPAPPAICSRSPKRRKKRMAAAR